MALCAACVADAPSVASPPPQEVPEDDEPAAPRPECTDPVPLVAEPAEWSAAPFAPPGDTPSDPGDSDDDGELDEGGATEGGIFIAAPDGGGISFECDIWAQDCPRGEKCMPWSNDGSGNWNATRCSPVDDDAGVQGEDCTVEGGPTSGIDDCELGAMCWDVDRRTNAGSCVTMCTGNEEMPLCDSGSWCLQSNNGSIAVCLDESLCEADGACQCLCPEGMEDPDCRPDQCVAADAPLPDELRAPPPEFHDGERILCPDTTEPVVLYMSNDDSNSQASPAVARRLIQDGELVPWRLIRVHEFLNYFDFPAPAPVDGKAARVSVQMRRTTPDSNEMTLVLNARAKAELSSSRAPINVVFSLDSSGSMAGTGMHRLRDTLTAAAGQLREGDLVSIVTWSTSQDVLLDGYAVSGPDDPMLLGVIDTISAAGGTDLHAGLVEAYALANANRLDGGINRVVLISDGGANAGVTDVDLIASEAAGEDGEGIYLVGVGVGGALDYNEELMNEVTDAGKGAYVYIDSAAEADKQFGARFIANMGVAARNVRMKLTLPWYFGVMKFHGEEISSNPAEVEPQHLAPNDSMTFHQTIAACDSSLLDSCAEVTARVDYIDPITGAEAFDEISVPMAELFQQPADLLRKGDVVVGYAKALVVIGHLTEARQYGQALAVAQNMQSWVAQAAENRGDPELAEIATLLGQYAVTLASYVD